MVDLVFVGELERSVVVCALRNYLKVYRKVLSDAEKIKLEEMIERAEERI